MSKTSGSSKIWLLSDSLSLHEIPLMTRDISTYFPIRYQNYLFSWNNEPENLPMIHEKNPVGRITLSWWGPQRSETLLKMWTMPKQAFNKSKHQDSAILVMKLLSLGMFLQIRNLRKWIVHNLMPAGKLMGCSSPGLADRPLPSPPYFHLQ